MQAGPAEVAVDREHPTVPLRHDGGEVGDGRRLSLGGSRRGHEHDLGTGPGPALVLVDAAGVVERRAQRPERLRGPRSRFLEGEDPRRLPVLAAERRNLREHGKVEGRLDVGLAAQLGVEPLGEHDVAEADHRAEERAGDAARGGTLGQGRAGRRGHGRARARPDGLADPDLDVGPGRSLAESGIVGALADLDRSCVLQRLEGHDGHARRLEVGQPGLGRTQLALAQLDGDPLVTHVGGRIDQQLRVEECLGVVLAGLRLGHLTDGDRDPVVVVGLRLGLEEADQLPRELVGRGLGLVRRRADGTHGHALDVVAHVDPDLGPQLLGIAPERGGGGGRDLALGEALGELGEVAHVDRLVDVGEGPIHEQRVARVVADGRDGGRCCVLGDRSAGRAERRADDGEQHDRPPAAPDGSNQM